MRKQPLLKPTWPIWTIAALAAGLWAHVAGALPFFLTFLAAGAALVLVRRVRRQR